MLPLTRRDFLGTSGRLAAGVAAGSALDLGALLASAPATAAAAPPPTVGAKRRLAVVGTGIRATRAWGRELLKEQGERVEIVGLCDVNAKRAAASRELIGIQAPTFTELDAMLKATRPDALLVTTRDASHDAQIVHALRAGVDVITEKPMTTDEVKCAAILDAERRSGRTVTVAFNYRYAPTAARLKELLSAGTIGEVTSVDFHWYLDNRHGADYFRRWHAYRANSGTLWVHKATHHFDLVNWYLGADPVEVGAMGALRRYGKNGPFRGVNCRTCPHAARCEYAWRMTDDPVLAKLYAECESEDGYLRDACVFREDIDIYDTMAATVRYSTGAVMSYSVNAFMPIEGYHLAFNGPKGRIEVRMFERQPWEVPRGIDEIRVTGAFGGSEVIPVRWGEGGHYGGDPLLRRMLFEPGRPDPLGQRAGSRAGAMSLLTGVAADRSIQRGRPVRIDELLAPGRAGARSG
jgi:predicted dehydrogenase